MSLTPDYTMYDEVTLNFRKLMTKELAANYDKGDREGEKGWLTMTPKMLLSEIYYHTGKLQQAISENDVDKIAEYCADIANGAMMCCDKFVNLK